MLAGHGVPFSRQSRINRVPIAHPSRANLAPISWQAYWAYLAPFEPTHSAGRPSSGWHVARLALETCGKVTARRSALRGRDVCTHCVHALCARAVCTHCVHALCARTVCTHCACACHVHVQVAMYGFSMEADDFHYFDSAVQEKVAPQQHGPAPCNHMASPLGSRGLAAHPHTATLPYPHT